MPFEKMVELVRDLVLNILVHCINSPGEISLYAIRTCFEAEFGYRPFSAPAAAFNHGNLPSAQYSLSKTVKSFFALICSKYYKCNIKGIMENLGIIEKVSRVLDLYADKIVCIKFVYEKFPVV